MVSKEFILEQKRKKKIRELEAKIKTLDKQTEELYGNQKKFQQVLRLLNSRQDNLDQKVSNV